MSSPSERRTRAGCEQTTPRTPDDFARCWKESSERKQLLQQIEQFDQDHPLDGVHLDEFALSRKLEKSAKQRERSPYTLSFWRQIRLCMWREYQMLKSDPSVPIGMIVMNFTEAIIIASIFYNLPKSTESFFSRGAVIFMVVGTSCAAHGYSANCFRFYSTPLAAC
jgi:ATP-binding cassette subfamily G (WHITE) protein 2 (PDR)